MKKELVRLLVVHSKNVPAEKCQLIQISERERETERERMNVAAGGDESEQMPHGGFRKMDFDDIFYSFLFLRKGPI